MLFRGLFVGIALGLATLTSAGAAEPVPSPAADAMPGAAAPVSCGLGGVAYSVKPLYIHEDAGYTAFDRFAGAEVFVPAQPGLTAEWLNRALTSQVVAGDCYFGVPRVDVEVLSAGGGFSVRLTSHDGKGASEILSHAQQMLK
jgi:hypothetical protein